MAKQKKIRDADIIGPLPISLGGTGIDLTGLPGGSLIFDGSAVRVIPTGGLQSTYLFDTTAHTAADPGTGYLRLNNADPTLATFMYISQTSNAGRDMTDVFNAISGDTIILDDPSTTDTRVLYTAGAVLDLGTYWSIAITYVSGGGTEIVQDQPITFKLDIGGSGGVSQDTVIFSSQRSFAWPNLTAYNWAWNVYDGAGGVTVGGGDPTQGGWNQYNFPIDFDTAYFWHGSTVNVANTQPFTAVHKEYSGGAWADVATIDNTTWIVNGTNGLVQTAFSRSMAANTPFVLDITSPTFDASPGTRTWGFMLIGTRQ